MKIFVCHYTPLTQRRETLQKQLDRFGLTDVEWITEADAQDLDLDAWYDGSQEAFAERHRTAFRAFGYGEYSPLTRPCVELTAQHILAQKRLADQELDSAVVFEDDVVLGEDFADRLARYVDELPADWDMFYFGAGHSGALRSRMSLRDRVLYWRGRKHVFPRHNRQSRWTDSYMVRRKAAETMLTTIVPFQFAIDWELNYQQTIHELNVYWAEPPLSEQGSGRGYYASSLDQG